MDLTQIELKSELETKEIHALACDIIHCVVRFVKTGFNLG